jgi:hypothetical protein
MCIAEAYLKLRRGQGHTADEMLGRADEVIE